jgi:aminoglycoside phosphotransferase (APT) family kinase protein
MSTAPDAPDNDLVDERHRAGHSNETFFVRHSGRDLVLRRPPRGAFLPTAHDVGREFRVLHALDDASVRTPRTVLECTDEGIIGAPFYIMERVRGIVIREEVPSSYVGAERAAIGDELVDALVELHSVDVGAVGLDDFGKPEGYLVRQLRRWSGQLELTLPHTRPLPELQKVGEWLHDNIPAPHPATLVHGDYKLDNTVISETPPARLKAILDWEMSTLGDPLADLGWMASFWLDPDERPVDVLASLGRVTAASSFRRRDDLVRRYEELTGRDTSALDWYRVLAVWKLAILLEGSYARHLEGMTDDPFFARMEAGVPALAKRALEIAKA